MQEHNEKKGKPIQRIPSLVGVFAFILFPFVSIWCCAKHGHTNILTCQRLLSRVRGTCEVVAAGRENAHRPAGRSVRQETSTLAAAVKAGQVLFSFVLRRQDRSNSMPTCVPCRACCWRKCRPLVLRSTGF
jgi:hypothetical protein